MEQSKKLLQSRKFKFALFHYISASLLLVGGYLTGTEWSNAVAVVTSALVVAQAGQNAFISR